MLADLPNELIDIPKKNLNNKQEYTYSVLSKHMDYLDNIYNDMEHVGTNGHVPHRKVDCVNRRPHSCGTFYKLTPIEAEKLKHDPRIKDVHLTMDELGINPKPCIVETSSNWDKSTVVSGSMINWGLLRMVNGHISGWGTDANSNQSGAITLTSTGQNVDVIICDGHIKPGHPEFAVNPSGSGGSRVIQYNWLSLTNQVNGEINGIYNYTLGSATNNNHGNHVAGTACGNTCGWARNSNIYNIYPYNDYTGAINTYDIFTYVKLWHQQKPINPITGVKNPTIMNMSWGNTVQCYARDITSVYYRGTTYTPPARVTWTGRTAYDYLYDGPNNSATNGWTCDGLANLGLRGYEPYIKSYPVFLVYSSYYDPTLESDVISMMNAGVLCCAAAGNNSGQTLDVLGGIDYNNYFMYSGYRYYSNSNSPGGSQGSTDGKSTTYGATNYLEPFCVGSISALSTQQTSTFSNTGKKVNIWAPGENIMSSWGTQANGDGSIADPRNSSYFLNKSSGTSMATPQITGFVACILEQYPNMTQQQTIKYVQSLSNNNIIPDPNAGQNYDKPYLSSTLSPADNYTHIPSDSNLYGAFNGIPMYNYERPINGNTFPKQNHLPRTIAGKIYPRPPIKRS